MASRPAECLTAIVTSDTQVTSRASIIYWIGVSAGATGGAFQINDGINDGGTDKFDVTVAASTGPYYLEFDPPIKCGTGLFIDVPGTNLKVNVGYV